MSWGGTSPDSAAAHEARAKGRKHGRLIGLVMKLAGDITDDSVKQFADKHGMSAKDSAEFHANHIRLPLPGTASDVLTGPLPGTDRQGDLAWLEFSSAVDMQRNYTAVVVETPAELPSAWVDADDVTVPGFGEGLPQAALELAREHGLGLSTHGRKACVYLATPLGDGRVAERRRDRGLRAECGGDCRRAERKRTQRSLNRLSKPALGSVVISWASSEDERRGEPDARRRMTTAVRTLCARRRSGPVPGACERIAPTQGRELPAVTVRIEESVEIARPVPEVWDAIADYAFDLKWRSGLTDMSPDPPGGPEPGTKVHEVVRTSGREYVADTVVTELDPGVSYSFAGEGTIGGLAGGRSVDPAPSDGGAVFTYRIELEPRGGMRLLRPVLGPIVRSGLRKDLQTLKATLEGRPPA